MVHRPRLTEKAQPPRRVRGPGYPEHKKTSVWEALLKLFQDRMDRGQTFCQLTRKALQPELEAIVRKLTGNDPAEIELNRAGERASYCNMVKYIFENEFRKGATTARPGARSSASKRGSPARGFAKILAKTRDPMADLAQTSTGLVAQERDTLHLTHWFQSTAAAERLTSPGLAQNGSTFEFLANTLDAVDEHVVDHKHQGPPLMSQEPGLVLANGPLREPVADTDSNSEPVADTDSTSLDDDIRDWADTDDDADPCSRFLVP